MDQERERPTRADFDEALDQATQPRPQPHTSMARPARAPGRNHPAWVVLSVAVLCGSLWVAWMGMRDPFPVDAEALTADAVTMVDVARLAVEDYWQREGALPPDLSAVGLGALPVTYTPSADAFDITAPDGWGDVVGYHGARETDR